MNSSALVRPATAADLGQVAAIFGHYVTTTVISFEETPPSVASWRRRFDELADRRFPFLVAEVDGAVGGYGYVSPWRPKPTAHTVEDSVYLAPHQRGHGLGRQLLEGLLAGCRTAAVSQVIAVIADTGDPASVNLHRACGFADAALLSKVGVKHGREIDTILMQREISSAEPGAH